ncbi:MAG: histidine kinase [Solirubrobacteraceae bacterium]|nr:histidine kinase [Solirubrobacteraceae bacterium]
MSGGSRALALVVAAGLALTAGALAVAAQSPRVEGTWQFVVIGVSVGLPFLVAAFVMARYRERRPLWLLLIAIGTLYAVRVGAVSDDPHVYTVARAAGQFSGVLLGWLMLAFPSGRLGSRAARAVVAAGALSVAALWWPQFLLDPTLSSGGEPYGTCDGPCPANVLDVTDAEGVARALGVAFRVCAAGLLVGVAVVLAVRLHRATALMRRILAPVLVASVARLAAVSAFLALGSPAWIRGFLVVTYWGVLAAIVAGLLRGRSYDAAALERLVHGLRVRPAPAELETVLGRALDDPSLRIAYWIPQAELYTDAAGEPLALPESDPARAITPVHSAAGEPLAALLHDPGLLDHPELLDAMAASALIALESNRLEAEMAAARGGVIVAVEEERRRIERDLHDGAQQRLIALRMKLGAAGQLVERDADRARAMLDELGGDVDAALAEVRALAHGETPAELAELGLDGALARVVREAPIPAQLTTAGLRRHPAAVESAVYFACREALQNAAKHAGAQAAVEIVVRDEGGSLSFTVSDDGHGFVTGQPGGAGAGLGNLRDRLSALGGAIDVESSPGGGTRVSGTIPLDPA